MHAVSPPRNSPTEFDAFLAHLLASGLIGHEELLDALKSFHVRRDASDVPRLGDQLVATNLLTRWQCDKLRDGRYKGFYLNKFIILDSVSPADAHYLAKERDSHRRVVLSIRRNPTWPEETEYHVVREGE